MKVRNRTNYSINLLSHCGDSVQIQPRARAKIDDKFSWHIDETQILIIEPAYFPPEPARIVEEVPVEDNAQGELPLVETSTYVDDKAKADNT